VKKSQTSIFETVGRNVVAFSIVFGVIVGLIVLAVVIIINAEPENRSDTANTLLVALLPLFGTWVGTVLAYYFSKENFEAAADRSLELITATSSREKLESTPVQSWMRGIANMRYETWTDDWAGSTKVNDLINAMRNGKGQRLPILTAAKQPLYMVHSSALTEYVQKKVAAGFSTDDIANLTVKDFLADEELKRLATDSFAIVAVTKTMADAKDAMERVARERKVSCKDVFVTQSGQSGEPVLGWITDNKIQEASFV
jgi:hypothetical protein